MPAVRASGDDMIGGGLRRFPEGGGGDILRAVRVSAHLRRTAACGPSVRVDLAGNTTQLTVSASRTGVLTATDACLLIPLTPLLVSSQ